MTAAEKRVGRTLEESVVRDYQENAAHRAQRFRVTAYDHEGRVRFITAEWDRRTAEDIAAALIPEDDVASVHVERLEDHAAPTP